MFTGYIDDNSTPGVYSGVVGNVMTITAITSGTISVGDIISGPGILQETYVVAFLTGVGGIGTYLVSFVQATPSGNITSMPQFGVGTPITFISNGTITASITNTILTVTSATAGTLGSGYTILNNGVIANTKIVNQITPIDIAAGESIGGIGRYIIDTTQNVSSTTMLVKTAHDLNLYDSYYVSYIDGNIIRIAGKTDDFDIATNIAFEYGRSYLYSLIPLAHSADVVLYNNVLYQCKIGNNDVDFDFNKWTQIEMNALDRIEAYYQPDVNMVGKDVTQLVSGTTNPLVTYSGSPFSPTYTNDVIIQDLDWARLPSTATNVVKGASFSYGYGPEEMVAGVVSDLLTVNVYSNDAQLDFRITVEKDGFSTVHNVNPYTQTTLAADFTRLDDTTDTMIITDVTKITYIDTVTAVADASGVATVTGIQTNQILQITVSDPNWSFYGNNTIIVTGLAPAAVTTVSIVYGAVILINNEFIGFTGCDVNIFAAAPGTPGTISGLRRGLLRSSINLTIPAGTLIQSVLARDALPTTAPANLQQNWWYGSPNDTAVSNTTLATNTSPAALILQRIV